MTTQIALTLLILLISVVLFITEKIRIDLTALLVLGAVALTGLVTPAEAISGFSNPAVITVWAVFIMSGGLSRTGVANIIGKQVLRLAGSGEVRLLIVIVLTSGILSAFMNNVGVVAMLLPVVMNIARRTRVPPSKLLMPLAYGSLLGGMTTLIATPPNILASDALRDAGFQPFNMFDFAPVGGAVFLVGLLYLVLIGRRLLPVRNLQTQLGREEAQPLGQVYDLASKMGFLQIPENTSLAGKTLAESRIGSTLGLNVLAILRNGKTFPIPGPDQVLEKGDRLLVSGELEHFRENQGRRQLIVEKEELSIEQLFSSDLGMAEVSISYRSKMLGKTLQQIDFRRKYGVLVLAIWRNQKPIREDIDNLKLLRDDVLIVQGPILQIRSLNDEEDLLVSNAERTKVSRIGDQLMLVGIPEDSSLVGKKLAESRVAEAYGLTVLGIIRNGKTMMMPDTETVFEAGDSLLVKGEASNVEIAGSLGQLMFEPSSPNNIEVLESETVGMVEAVLSPRSAFEGSSLRQLFFREKYGVSVLALMRGGKIFRTALRDRGLRPGDGLLLFGKRDKFAPLAEERDIILLEESLQESLRTNRAWLASMILVGVVVSVLFGWLPISIAAIIGAALMVLTGCLTMDEAYQSIDWRAVFLIAGMLPLGIAMQNTGAATYLAQQIILLVGDFGTTAVIAGLFVLTSFSSQFMPNAVVTVLMAPIAITTAVDLQVSPFAFIMAVALAASTSFISPVGHPSNVLVMGPGCYKFSDYVKVGLPMLVLILITVLFVLPIFWPLN